MQGATRFALPYIVENVAQNAVPHQIEPSQFVSRFQSAVPGVLVIVEAVAIMLSGVSAAVLGSSFTTTGSPRLGSTELPADDMIIAALIGTAISPILLGTGRLRPVDRALIRAVFLQLLTTVVLSIGIAMMIHPTGPAPILGGALWFTTSLALVLAGRAGTVASFRSQHTTSQCPHRGATGWFKQGMDRCLALLLLLWMTPLLLLIAAAVQLDSPGPILFRQRREGLNGVEFDIFKFRTMVWQGADAGSGAVQTNRGDKRITRVGAFLRQSSLDEVPQLLNVLNGTMSLVGPRPHPTAMLTERMLGAEITPDYAQRHRVRPGITGWAQINGLRGATETAEQLRRRVEHDNYYIENCGIM